MNDPISEKEYPKYKLMGKIRNYSVQEYYWQNLSKKARSQLYPIFNSPRNKDRQTYIQIIKITLDPFKSKTD